MIRTCIVGDDRTAVQLLSLVAYQGTTASVAAAFTDQARTLSTSNNIKVKFDGNTKKDAVVLTTEDSTITVMLVESGKVLNVPRSRCVHEEDVVVTEHAVQVARRHSKVRYPGIIYLYIYEYVH